MERNKTVEEKFGGGCEGNSTIVENCPSTNTTCPRSCEWGEWNTNWSDCSVTCGDGVQSRTRAISVTSEGGGKNCTDNDAVQSKTCKPRECPGV